MKTIDIGSLDASLDRLRSLRAACGGGDKKADDDAEGDRGHAAAIGSR